MKYKEQQNGKMHRRPKMFVSPKGALFAFSIALSMLTFTHSALAQTELKTEKSPLTLKTHGIISLVIGGCFLTAGSISGIRALQLNTHLKNQCEANQCLPPYHDDLESRNRNSAFSTVLLTTGTIVSAAGIVILTVFTKKTSKKKISMHADFSKQATSATFGWSFWWAEEQF